MIEKEQSEQDMSEYTLEQCLEQLQGTIEQLQGDSVSLEDSFSCYERGMRLVKACHEKIEAVEQKVYCINKAGGLDEF